MSGMWWFIIGIVIGGLSLWLFMREREQRLQAQIDATKHKKKVEKVSAPAVKTRKIGEGSSGGASKRRSKVRSPAVVDDSEE